ncbi:hypothetical protein KPP03845_100004 [Streptomyces xanthophaeus]|uniref:hypothetical protein n=1 Tax=Streptomyces xanthophaeus TaxID=67385 RepID=UPI00233F370B|nr:hypothetical protein [Streptomyces xanthophaeus]WCD83685.1 hypothetical protein KPP03845_100004 [Streptomyces xanthophaeus]
MKKCLFCSRSAPEVKMSGEHVLRRELNNQVLWEPAKQRTEILVQVDEETGKPVARSREIPQSILDQKLNDVCRDCNAGWMNDLENRAEKKLVPLLRGEHTDVGKTDAEVLATWAAKTAMVRARVNGDPYTVPEAHRTHIMTTDTPPANLTVWAAACEPHPSARTRHYKVAIEMPGTPITETDEDGDSWVIGVESKQSLGHVTTIVINHLALFIAEADSEELHTSLVTQIDPTGTATKLWPNPHQFNWPLSPVLTPDQVDGIGSLIQPIPGTATR